MKLDDLCQKHFGYKPKPVQRRLILAGIKGIDSFGVLPTGCGKTLVFMLQAARCKAGEIVVVFSPLISLMKDQVNRAVEARIPAVALSSDRDDEENRKAMRRIREGKIKLVFVAPERLKNLAFIEVIKTLSVKLIAIDECHPAGELVDTPTGPRTVESLQVGDAVVGIGEDGSKRTLTVKATDQRTILSSRVLDIRLDDGVMISVTDGHPVMLWGVGFVPASSLRPGDFLATGVGHGLSSMRDSGAAKAQGGSLLQPPMLRGSPARPHGGETPTHLSDVQDVVRTLGPSTEGQTEISAYLFAQVLEGDVQSKDGKSYLPGLLTYLYREGVFNCEELFTIMWVILGRRCLLGTHAAEQSNAFALRAKEAIRHYEEEGRPVSKDSWGQRPSAHRAAEAGAKLVSYDVDGVSYCGWVEIGRGRTNDLCGFGMPPYENCNRSRWGFPQEAESASLGQRARPDIEARRVASVEIAQRVHNEAPREGEEPHTCVYSITVEGGNYLTNGVLVHNCHTISAFQKDFRPAFGDIRKFTRRFPDTPITALTATADDMVEKDIITALGFKKFRRVVASPYRDNLQFTAVRNLDADKIPRLLASAGEGAKIVYCSSRKECERIAETLRGHRMDAQPYHAGLEKNERADIQNKFMDGRIETICATNAFGMGVDKRDVRVVLHWHIPDSLFSYVQEAGRGGRDGLPTKCILNLSSKGMQLRNFFIRMANPKLEIYERIWEYIQGEARPKESVKTNEKKIRMAARLPEALGGQAMSALRFMEHHKGVSTLPGKKVYYLPIRQRGLAFGWSKRLYDCRVWNDVLMVKLDPDQDDPVWDIVGSGACAYAPPNTELVIRRLSGPLVITADMIDDKLAADNAKVRLLMRFADTLDKDKPAFINEQFLQ